MLIRSSFLRNLISKVINKALKKQFPGVIVRLNDAQASYSNDLVKVHLELDAEVTKDQLMDILQKADVL